MATIPITLKYKHGGSYREHEMEIDLSFTGEMLKAQIFSLTEVDPEIQRIFIGGKMVRDDDNMGAVGLKAKQIVMMVVAQDSTQTSEKAELLEQTPLTLRSKPVSNVKLSTRAVIDYHTLRSTSNANTWYGHFHSFRRPIDEYSRGAVRRGDRAKVAILDSGIDMSHERILEAEKRRIKERRSFLDEALDDANDSDSSRHGTQVALLLLKEAPFAEIYVARVKKDDSSPLRPETVTKAIEYAVDIWDVDILSMSWGFTSEYGIVAQAIRKASEKGKIMFVAASNTGANLSKEIEVTFPANMSDVICINSTDGYGDKSNFNPPPRKGHYNFSTLGEAVLDTWKSVASDELRNRESGTSFAAPLAAAIAASFIEFLRQDKFKRLKIPEMLKKEVRTRDGILKILIAISRESEGFNYLQPWSLLQCKSPPGRCPDRCIQAREDAGRKISNILRDILLQPADLAVIATAPGLTHVVAADARASMNEYKSVCLRGTRVEVLQHIEKWADGGSGKCICWLRGRLGTGKSTVSRTAALRYAEQGRLGGTFFFSKNEKDLQTLSKFVGSLAHQLGQISPSLKLAISKVKSDDAEIEQLAMRIQWKRLICNPLSLLESRDSPIIIVIDALDECEGLDTSKLMGIINLFISAAALENVALRFLITSRPEINIQTAFAQFPEEVYHIAMDDLDKHTVDLDISRLFEDEFRRLRQGTRGIEDNWPSEEQQRGLIERSNGLFIYAAMICRYLGGLAGNKASSVKTRLARIFQDQAFDTLDDMYNDILKQAVAGEEEETLMKQFKMILGVIVALFEPMPEESLCKFCLGEPEVDIVYSRLDSLRSVLTVPETNRDAVYISHHSFREFLLKRRDADHLAWMNEQAHRDLFIACIRLLSSESESGLRQDIFGLVHPGTEIHQVDGKMIETHIPVHTRYACRHWIYHLKELGPSERHEIGLGDDGMVHGFLQTHLLHWLEALGWLSVASEGVRIIRMLGSMVNVNKSPKLHAFVKDAERFILHNRDLIENTPLQVYCSALVFAPQRSLIRQRFEQVIPSWILELPQVQPGWTLLRTTLEHDGTKIVPYERGHTFVAFSDDGELVVSIILNILHAWDTTTGKYLNKVESLGIPSFSPKAKLVALITCDDAVEILDVASGAIVRKHVAPSSDDKISSVAFSPDGRLMALGTKARLVHLWEVKTGRFLRALDDAFQEASNQDKYRYNVIEKLAYSSDNSLIVASSTRLDPSYTELSENGRHLQIYVWSVNTGSLLHTCERCQSYVFSPKDKLIAIISFHTLYVVYPETNSVRYTIDDCDSVAFSPDGILATVQLFSMDPRLLDAATGVPTGTVLHPTGQAGLIKSIGFSPNGKLLIVIPFSRAGFFLWEVSTGEFHDFVRDNQDPFSGAVFSPDSSVIALNSEDGIISLWDVPTAKFAATVTDGESDMMTRAHNDAIRSLLVSPTGGLVVSTAEAGPIAIWNTEKEGTIPFRQLPPDIRATRAILLSDAKLLVFGVMGRVLQFWDTVSLKLLYEELLTTRRSLRVMTAAVSPDNKTVAAFFLDNTGRSNPLYLFDTETGDTLWIQEYQGLVDTIAVSRDGKRVAIGGRFHTDEVKVWDVTTSEMVQEFDIKGRKPTALAFSADGEMLIMQSESWDGGGDDAELTKLTALGSETLRGLSPGEGVQQLFSSDTKTGYILSNRGLLRMTPDDVAVTIPDAGNSTIHPLFVGKSWITYGGRKILWLPPSYRPKHVAVKDHLVVLGCESGEVLFIKFDLGGMPKMATS